MTPTPRRHPLHHPWSVWLAVLIAVLGALAPTVSHALMPAMGQAPQGFEICTDQGPRWVPADVAASADDSTPGPKSAAPTPHCQFCLQTTDRGTFPSDPLPNLFLVQDGQRESPVWQAFFYPSIRSFLPPPRGPPGHF
ncbi:MAG: DUF2946 family protein [Burkholderiaceae bacterium]|nr:DUF2946 family protein [Burkholderiaceae bacterium]